MSKAEATHFLIVRAVSQMKVTYSALAELKKDLLRLAELLPEYPVVQKMYDVGSTLDRSLWMKLAM